MMQQPQPNEGATIPPIWPELEVKPDLKNGEIFFNEGDVYVFEIEPSTRIITVKSEVDPPYCECGENHHGDTYDSQSFSLALPWVYFVMEIKEWAIYPSTQKRFTRVSDIYVFFSPTRLKTINDPVYSADMWNVDEGGYVCWGSTQVVTNDNDNALAVGRAHIAAFFDSHFNNEIDKGILFGSWDEWERQSRLNEKCWEGQLNIENNSLRSVLQEYSVALEEEDQEEEE